MKLLQGLKQEIAARLIEVGAVLTLDNTDHPLFVCRPKPDGRGKESGYKLQLHREKPEAPLLPFYFNLR